jgi:hypothetical protein
MERITHRDEHGNVYIDEDMNTYAIIRRLCELEEMFELSIYGTKYKDGYYNLFHFTSALVQLCIKRQIQAGEIVAGEPAELTLQLIIPEALIKNMTDKIMGKNKESEPDDGF